MDNTLEQSIIQTLAYFDIFDYPLTREELFLYLWQPPENLQYSDFVLQMESLLQNELATKIELFGGYYFFSGRREIIAKRERKILYTEERIKIAKKGTKKLRYVPFVRALFVCNQLPVGVKKNSDIDVFIVVKEGRMWLTRFFITVIFSIFRLRRTQKNIERRLCLSFYVTDNNLDLSNICIESPDIYQSYWNKQLIPIYDPKDLYTKIQEQNIWVKQDLPNASIAYHILNRFKVSDIFITRGIKNILEWILQGSFGKALEKCFRFLQRHKMNIQNAEESISTHKSVVISDTMLKFHENDRKRYFKEEWEKRWKSQREL